MKKYISLLIIPLFMVACTGKKEEKKKMQNDKDSLMAILSEKDKSINEYFSSFNEIQENLDIIKEKQKIITEVSTDPEKKISAKEQIQADIEVIYNLILKNKDIISNLNKKLKNNGQNIKKLEETIAMLQKQVEEKNAEIMELQANLAKTNINVAKLTVKFDSISTITKNEKKIIEQKDEEMNSAYYLIGTKKELFEKKIVSKEGGFLGLGRIIKLNDEYEKNGFVKVNKTDFKALPIYKKKVKLLTTHNPDSYTLTGKDIKDRLEIKNQNNFWQFSNYLVIMTD